MTLNEKDTNKLLNSTFLSLTPDQMRFICSKFAKPMRGNAKSSALRGGENQWL